MGIKWAVERHDFLIPGLNLNKYDTVKCVGQGGDTQHQVGKTINYLT